VPSVIGMDGEEADTALTAAGFYVEVNVQQSNQPAGTVIAQRPQAGLRAEQTSTVTIIVSQSLSH
jgi:beta-lactam-binding protein with PASTA domain